jgi:transcriptional regulator with XRE-family HTH domain
MTVMDSSGTSFSERLTYYVARSRKSQTVIAGLCGITPRYLRMLMRGERRAPTTDIASALATALQVPLSELVTGERPQAASVSTQTEVARAMMRCAGRGSSLSGLSDVEDLRERVDRAWLIWQTSKRRFSEVTGELPQLIGDVETALRDASGGPPSVRRGILQAGADLYMLLRSYCRRTGRLDLALLAAERGLRAAEEADDPLRMAAGQWNLGHVLLSRPEEASWEEAKEGALRAAADLDRSGRGSSGTALSGALQLVAVVADAKQRNWDQARGRLTRVAQPLGEQAGDGNVMRTVFGPTNVAMHAMSIEMLAGEATEALRVADKIHLDGVPSRERRFTFGLEVTRCYDLRGEDAAVLTHLLGLEKLAPEDLARNPLARSIATRLQRRVRPTFRPQADGLARRLGLD